MWLELFYLVLLVVFTTLLLHFYYKKKAPTFYQGKHVVITGGSEGMGRQLAEEFYRFGARVTIMARTVSKLEKAKAEILKAHVDMPNHGSIEFVSVDVSDYAAVCKAMAKAVELQGGVPIFTLINGAGKSVPGYFVEQDPKVFQDTMSLNYMGSVNCTKAAVDNMIKTKTEGQIVFIASAAATVSFTGYSSYAPSKFAVRGLADSLRNELKGFHISVHIAYPPDTDTPGFEAENKSKPAETKLISPPEVYSAKSVADHIIDGLLCGEYHLSSPDLVQNLLVSTTTTITPRGRWAAVELVLLPILGLAMLAFKLHADRHAYQYGRRVLMGGQ